MIFLLVETSKNKNNNSNDENNHDIELPNKKQEHHVWLPS